MKQLSVQINNLIVLLIIGVVGLTPLIFSTGLTEYYDSAKIVFLVGAVVVLYLLWSLSWVLQGKVTFTKTPLDLPLILLLVVIILSTLFSDSKNDAIFGNLPKVHGSAASWIAYILFYFVTASHLKSLGQIKTTLFVLLSSASVAALVALSSYFGFFLPFDFAKVANFNLTGSSFSTAALLILLLPSLLISLANSQSLNMKIILTALSTLFLVTILLIGGNSENDFKILLSPSFLALYLALALSALVIRKHHLKTNLNFFIIPIFISLLITAFGFLPFKNNPLYLKRVNFPREIQLSFSNSWQISGQSFVKDPFLGSGPSTYLYNFTAFKAPEFNLDKFWNLNFDSANNEYLQVLGTLGALGFLAFFAFSLVAISFSYSSFNKNQDSLRSGLAIAGLTSIGLLLVHVSTPVVIVAILTILALMMALHKQVSGKVEELTIGIKASKSDSSLVIGDLLPIIIFVPVLFLSLIFAWKFVKVIRADMFHRQALNSASSRGIDTYNLLGQAERLNPDVALYRVDLARTNFVLANSLALSKGPTEASPGGSLTDNDKQIIQQLLSQSINESRVATVLSPRNTQNWIVLAEIYRQISGVAQNANDFALDSYGRAIQRDPNNPVLRLNVGGIYYSVKNYEMAVRFFDDAAKLKPDYANAFYNLSIALKDKGDLQNAYLAGQKVLQLLQADPNNQDYKTASSYVADLKSKVEEQQKKQDSQVAGTSTSVPPAAEQNGALQQNNLPNVVDLGQKPQVATPAAVKSTPKPSPNP